MSEIKIPCDSLPTTLDGCLQILKRCEDEERKLGQWRREVLARMQDIVTSLPEKDIVTSLPENKEEEQQPSGGSNNKTVQFASSLNSTDEMSIAADEMRRVPTLRDAFGNQKRSDCHNKRLGTWRTCNFLWDNLNVQSDYSDDNSSTPFIAALSKLEWQYKDHKQIEKYCTRLTELFECSSNESGVIGENEYFSMVCKLPISDELQDELFSQFARIDHDGSGGINLTEFLYFFLQYKPITEELKKNLQLNKLIPNVYVSSYLQQKLRLIYKVVNSPEYNLIAKLLFYADLVLTLVPCIMLFVECICPRYSEVLLVWEDKIMWCSTIFFALQYILGFLTCENKFRFLTRVYHLIELISFLPWIVYKGGGYTGEDINPSGFVFFRVLRVFKLVAIFPSRFMYVEEQLRVYRDSLKLAYVSYKAFGTFIISMTLYLSMLMYVFERGVYNSDEKVWKRPGEDHESPFANFYNCIYFALVTGTTLGYGDMYPITYPGKILAIIIVFVGIMNITFLTNTIGDCFEEVLRIFLKNRIALIEKERSVFIRRNVHKAQAKMDMFKRKKKKLSINTITKKDTDFTYLDSVFLKMNLRTVSSL